MAVLEKGPRRHRPRCSGLGKPCAGRAGFPGAGGSKPQVGPGSPSERRGRCRDLGRTRGSSRAPRSRSVCSQGGDMRPSARNTIPATVTGVTQVEATANVELDAGGVRLVASITAEAARELGVAEGSRVVAVIKASDVILGVEG